MSLFSKISGGIFYFVIQNSEQSCSGGNGQGLGAGWLRAPHGEGTFQRVGHHESGLGGSLPPSLCSASAWSVSPAYQGARPGERTDV